jgi:uncharacterized protein YbcI
MDNSNSIIAQRIAKAALAFTERCTGHVPKSATVIVSEGTLVITLHDALSPAEKVLARTAEGAAQVQEFHRRLFASSADSLRQEIHGITGMAVREAMAEVEPATGAVFQAFTSGNVVQVFSLVGGGPSDSWRGDGREEPLTDRPPVHRDDDERGPRPKYSGTRKKD